MSDAPKLQLVPGGSESSCTFVVSSEDHTLGNALRYTLMRSMPHPSEAKINIRVQTKSSTTALDAFKTGLKDLVDAANHINATFEEALAVGPVGVQEELPPSKTEEVESKKSKKGSKADETTTTRKRGGSRHE